MVEETGAAVTRVRPGDHVVLSYLACGGCRRCLQGHPYYCDSLGELNFSGARLDGSSPLSSGQESVQGKFFGQSSFATYSLASERNAIEVDADLPLDVLAPLGCGVQTGAGSVFNVLRPQAGSSIAIFGTGSVGLSALMAARVVGCTPIIGIDVVPKRLTLAESLGATHTIDPRQDDPIEAIRQITGGGVDYSFETTALPAVFGQALKCLAAMGTCGTVVPPDCTEHGVDLSSLIRGCKVCGIIEGECVSAVAIPQMVELYRQGLFPIDRLITTYGFDQINQAAADSLNGATVKPVLQMVSE